MSPRRIQHCRFGYLYSGFLKGATRAVRHVRSHRPNELGHCAPLHTSGGESTPSDFQWSCDSKGRMKVEPRLRQASPERQNDIANSEARKPSRPWNPSTAKNTLGFDHPNHGETQRSTYGTRKQQIGGKSANDEINQLGTPNWILWKKCSKRLCSVSFVSQRENHRRGPRVGSGAGLGVKLGVSSWAPAWVPA